MKGSLKGALKGTLKGTLKGSLKGALKGALKTLSPKPPTPEPFRRFARRPTESPGRVFPGAFAQGSGP